MWPLFHPKSWQLSFPALSVGVTQVWSNCWTYLLDKGDGMGQGDKRKRKLTPTSCHVLMCQSDFRLHNVWPPRYAPMHEYVPYRQTSTLKALVCGSLTAAQLCTWTLYSLYCRHLHIVDKIAGFFFYNNSCDHITWYTKDTKIAMS